MRKQWYRRWLMIGLVSGICLGGGCTVLEWQEEWLQTEVNTDAVSNEYVIPGGMAVGIYMELDGVLVLGTDSVKSVDGMNYEPAEHLVKSGDYIVGFNQQEVHNKKELLSCVQSMTGESVILKLRRNEEILTIKIKPVQTTISTYQLGIWIRDNVQGLGTISYIKADGSYGALGHGIHDVDTNELLAVSSGRLYQTKIKGIQKGTSGNPGGLEGMIVYNIYNQLGTIEQNTKEGIFGKLKRMEEVVDKEEFLLVGTKKDLKKGKAYIRCSLDGTVKEYEVEITRIEMFTRNENKGIMIKVTDKELLNQTGGIVQGMSGSPIIQNGKLIGVVTHVLVNDPTTGYGIFIENMLDAAG